MEGSIKGILKLEVWGMVSYLLLVCVLLPIWRMHLLSKTMGKEFHSHLMVMYLTRVIELEGLS